MQIITMNIGSNRMLCKESGSTSPTFGCLREQAIHQCGKCEWCHFNITCFVCVFIRCFNFPDDHERDGIMPRQINSKSKDSFALGNNSLLKMHALVPQLLEFLTCIMTQT